MSDQPAPAPAPDAAPAAEPKPKPRLIRWKGLIALLIIVILFALVLPWVVERQAKGMITQALLARGWELTPDSTLQINLYRASIHGENLGLRLAKADAGGKQEQVFHCDRLHAGLAMLESLSKRDLIVDELALEGASGNLRRGPDGRPPVVATPEDTTGTGGGTDWKKVDWKSYYEKAMEYLKKRQAEKQQQEEQAKQRKPGDPIPEAEKLPPKIDPDWPQAKRYQPSPVGERHIPRVVVRKLAISGKGIQMPDDGPFDVASFTVNGTNLSARQDIGETMTLNGTFITTAAGDVSLDWVRDANDGGKLAVKAPSLPLEALNDPAVAGEGLNRYGLKGTANLDIPLSWQGWDLTGTINATIKNLELHPQDPDPKTKQVAQVIERLKGRDLPWKATVGGTLLKPTLTDTGVEGFIAAMKDAVIDQAKAEAIKRGTEEAQKQLDKQLEKNPVLKEKKEQLEQDPNVQKAKEGLKGLFGK